MLVTLENKVKTCIINAVENTTVTYEDILKARIKVPADHNPMLAKVLEIVNSNDEIKTLWHCINVNALDRLQMTDHGYIHFQIVANISLKISRVLKKHNVPLSIQKDHKLSYEHGELVIFLSSLFHDLGMTINREGHEEFSLILANRLLHDVLDFLPVIERTIVISETLHAIISHRSGGTPYTVEAGILRVSDALDMTQGRTRMFSEDKDMDIHKLSHSAIDSVDILEGEAKIINVHIKMNNSAGLFQVAELLKKKLKGSGLEGYVSVTATVESDQEKSLIKEFSF